MDSPWSFPSVLLILFPLFFLFLKRKLVQVNKKPTKNLPPGPPTLPIIGNIHQLDILAHQVLRQLSIKYGPVMSIKLGFVETVVISSSEAAKELLKTHDADTCSRPRLTGPSVLSYEQLDIVFAPYGDHWRDVKKLCVQEFFNAKKVQSFQCIRDEEISLLINSISLSSSSSDPDPVDLGEKLFDLTAQVICRAAFGKSYLEKGFGQQKFQQAVRECFAALGSFYAADFFPYVGWIIDRVAGSHAKLNESFQKFDNFYQKIIDDHILKLEKFDEKEDIVDALLEFERSQNKQSAAAAGYQFSKDRIKATLMNIFVAGLNTGSVISVWAMAEIIRNPRVMKKVQEEIRSVVGAKGKVCESDIEKLKYLKMVWKETLRLHPPAPLLAPRETISECSILGYDICPKTRIQVNVWAIGRDPKVWKNPEEFIPERFIDSPVDYKGTSYELLPFGSGRRQCPGSSMGMALVELALANLLYHFDWKLPDNNINVEDLNMEEAFSLAIRKKVPLLLVANKYQPAS